MDTILFVLGIIVLITIVGLSNKSKKLDPSFIPLEKINGILTFTVITDFNGLQSNKLHELTKNWMGGAFESAKSVIVSDTPSRIVGRYTDTYYKNDKLFYNRLTVDIKDDKVKYVVDNIEDEKGGKLEMQMNRINYATEKINLMYRSFVDYVQNPDW